MPIFEYKCKNCAKTFEMLLLGGSEIELKCPSCGSLKPEKQFSRFSSISLSRAECEGSPCSPQDCKGCHISHSHNK